MPFIKFPPDDETHRLMDQIWLTRSGIINRKSTIIKRCKKCYSSENVSARDVDVMLQ